MDWRDMQGNADVAVADIQPFGDFVLVEQEPFNDSLIIDPHLKVTGDGRYKYNNRDRGNRLGVVVACGPGDRTVVLRCDDCGCMNPRIDRNQRRGWKCSQCSGENLKFDSVSRATMNVRVGDRVWYPCVPVNDFKIGAKVYTFLHEEQHILGVIEEEVAA